MQAYTSTFRIVSFICGISFFAACSTSGPAGLFGKRSPHEEYADKLSNAGLKETALGTAWFNAATSSLQKPLQVKLPYSETGYFGADNARATAIKFNGKRGQKLTIALTKNPQNGFAVYMDVYRVNASSGENKYLQSGDTTQADLQLEVKEDGDYLIRLQPELLKSGNYTLSISVGPSLAFPVSTKSKTNIGSFWGAGRDNGARKHEGIDIFAPRRTPLLAAAPGVITRVGENNLGGKVIMLRPQGKDYTLYYAHLDEQLTQDGARVNTGDTIGLVGNTGNARTTSPHLHFGIYTYGGAIDPLPFVDPEVKKPGNITASKNLINEFAITERKTAGSGQSADVSIAASTPVYITGASGNQFKVLLPDSSEAFVQASTVKPLAAIRTIKLSSSKPLTIAPAATAPVIETLQQGETVEVRGIYGDYYFVKKQDLPPGWVTK